MPDELHAAAATVKTLAAAITWTEQSDAYVRDELFTLEFARGFKTAVRLIRHRARSDVSAPTYLHLILDHELLRDLGLDEETVKQSDLSEYERGLLAAIEHAVALWFYHYKQARGEDAQSPLSPFDV